MTFVDVVVLAMIARIEAMHHQHHHRLRPQRHCIRRVAVVVVVVVVVSHGRPAPVALGEVVEAGY